VSDGSRSPARSPLGKRARPARRRWRPELYERPIVVSRVRLFFIRSLALVVALAGAAYIHWRVGTLPGTGRLGLAFFAAEALNYATIVLTIVLFWRIRLRDGPAFVPSGSLDVFIPVCGEPVELVEETLRAALAIEYPHRTYLLNDGRIARKPNWEEIDELARRYNVRCFTRRTGARRKAGNLNHALAYTRGDFVATIDADHRARPQLAEETLGYFQRSDVAFVCTPQEFDGDDRDVLNNRELLFYRYMQPAKDADNAAHSCGNGSIYRRAALEELGGFSEWGIVEDVHTSYELHARGWSSVYHPRPLTTGVAPQTAAAFARQRLRWATDTLRIFFWQNPLFKRGLRLRQRLHYLHTMAYYVAGCTQLLFLSGPPLRLLWDVPIMHPTSAEAYVAHGLAYFGALAALLFLYGGVRGGLRVLQSTIFLSPVFVFALLRALTRARPSGVTEKAAQRRFSWLVMPQWGAIVLLTAAMAIPIAEGIGPDGLAAVAWAAWMIFALIGFGATVATRSYVTTMLRAGSRMLVALAVVAVVLPIGGVETPISRGAASVSQPAKSEQRGERKPVVQTVAPPVMALAPPRRGAYLGFFSPDRLQSPDGPDTWRRLSGGPASIVSWYQQWFSGERDFRRDWVENVARFGAVPMVTWEPWAKPPNSVWDADQPAVRLRMIAKGRYDAYIRKWARAAAAYRRPLLIRLMHEMNGFWYPWSIRANGNGERDFVAAWRHIHSVFEKEGADNVSWVWSINTFAGMQGDNRDLSTYYPGSRYVDWVSMTGFNWGDGSPWGSWQTIDEVFGSTYEALAEFKKPIMISEMGTVAEGGDPAVWVRDALERLRTAYPQVKAIVWFDASYPGGIDFTLRGAAAAELRSAVEGSRYWREEPTVVMARTPRRHVRDW
jgi:cellulose synthase (UDP-forming)